MAVVYTTAIKNARMAVVRDAIDAGTGPGRLKIGTTGFATVLADLPLSNPAGAISGGVLSLTPPALGTTAAASGTAVEARITDSANVVVVSGLTVGTTSADVLLNSVVIAAEQDVNITNATITHG